MTRSRLKPVSARRRKQSAARKRCIEEVKARSRGDCEANIRPGCSGVGSQAHERLRRSQGGDPTDPSNVLWVCQWCHDEIHMFPEGAARLGLLLTRKHHGAAVVAEMKEKR